MTKPDLAEKLKQALVPKYKGIETAPLYREGFNTACDQVDTLIEQFCADAVQVYGKPDGDHHLWHDHNTHVVTHTTFIFPALVSELRKGVSKSDIRKMKCSIGAYASHEDRESMINFLTRIETEGVIDD